VTDQPMSKTVQIKELKPGDVVSVGGQRALIHDVQRAEIFEGDVWEVTIIAGPDDRYSAGLYDGKAKTMVSEAAS
jgi:NifB/MoaA-like Fe-S oxidoreductase